MNKGKIIFSYEIGAYLSPLDNIRIEVLDDGSNIAIGTGGTDENNWLPKEPKTFSIGGDAVEQIRELLKKEDKVFTLQEDDIEEHPDYFVLDGYRQQFTFELEGKENTICCSNIQILEGEHEKCPNGAYLINVFRKIEKILKKAGVDKKYLRLSMN